MTWHKEAINAFLLDDPSKDVDPNRASRKSLSTLKKIFAIKTSKKSSWAKKDKTEEYDLDKLSRSVGELDGYTWADIGYGDIFESVRGDTLLDLALRNKKSTILIDGLRKMGAPAKNLGKLNAWQQECNERAKEFDTFESCLYFIPPHLQRLVGPDPTADHGLWQKRHFVFFPLDNTLEALTPLVPCLPQPEFRECPAYAIYTSSATPTQTDDDGVVVVVAAAAAEKEGKGDDVLSNNTIEEKQELTHEIMKLKNKHNDGGEADGERGTPSSLKHSDKEITRYIFEIFFPEDIRKPPLTLAAPTEKLRNDWIKVINKNKRNIPRTRIPATAVINVHTG